MRIALLVASAFVLCLTGCTWEGRHEYFSLRPPSSPDGSWLVGSNDQGYVGNQTGDYRTHR